MASRTTVNTYETWNPLPKFAWRNSQRGIVRNQKDFRRRGLEIHVAVVATTNPYNRRSSDHNSQHLRLSPNRCCRRFFGSLYPASLSLVRRSRMLAAGLMLALLELQSCSLHSVRITQLLELLLLREFREKPKLKLLTFKIGASSIFLPLPTWTTNVLVAIDNTTPHSPEGERSLMKYKLYRNIARRYGHYIPTTCLVLVIKSHLGLNGSSFLHQNHCITHKKMSYANLYAFSDVNRVL